MTSILSEPSPNNLDGVLQQMAELVELITNASYFTLWYYRDRFLRLRAHSRRFTFNSAQKSRYTDLVLRLKLNTQYEDIVMAEDLKDEPLISFSEQN